MNIGSNPTETITIPFSLCRKQNNYGKSIHILAMTGRGNVKMSSVTPKIRNIIAHIHRISPEDEAAISAFNCEVMFSVIDSLFAGVNFLIWLIGIGTILAGAIGVSNIMMDWHTASDRSHTKNDSDANTLRKPCTHCHSRHGRNTLRSADTPNV